MDSRIDIYNKKYLNSWAGEKTMQHASGIWGRGKLLLYLKEKIHSGDCVVDLGCGTGYPTATLAFFVGSKGKVIGLDNSSESIEIAQKTYSKAKNVSFLVHDISNPLPFQSNSVDLFTSFMVLHNLKESQMDTMFKEIKRCIKRKGIATFLTLHSDVFESDWDLTFAKYDDVLIKKWRETKEDDMLIPGFVVNADDKEKKPVFAYTHSQAQIERLLNKHSFEMIYDEPILIDRDTAIKRFGKGSIKKIPKTPTYWIFSIRNKSSK